MSRGESSLAAIAFAALLAIPLEAQETRTGSLELGGAVVAGGEVANYLRLRSLLDTVLASPWDGRLRDETPRFHGTRAFAGSPLQWRVLRLEVQARYNSALPLGRNDGVVWAGRGLTTALQGGAALSWRGLRAQIAPIAFVAQNAQFTLAPNGRTGALAYGDPRRPLNIDHVQRYGNAAYSRVDLGESFIAVDAFGATAGLSTAQMVWGPGREYPLVMSTNAGGFAHAFVGTSRPANVWIGSVTTRLIGGRLQQSAYSPVDTGDASRFTSGLVGTFSPRGFPGLELGATRVMQVRWPEGGPSLSQILRPFQTVVSAPSTGSTPNQNTENQFASVFVRLAPPGSGFEAYAEMSREDFTGNFRWFLLKPDDLAQILLGATRTSRAADGSLRVLRLELVNGETAQHERGMRGLGAPFPSYTHSRTNQGLTSRGQILGSPVAFGGAGGLVAWERYERDGRTSISAERILRLDWLPALGQTGGTPNAEVVYSLRYERLRFVGGREVLWSVAPSRVLNRNITVGNDLWNVELRALWRGW